MAVPGAQRAEAEDVPPAAVVHLPALRELAGEPAEILTPPRPVVAVLVGEEAVEELDRDVGVLGRVPREEVVGVEGEGKLLGRDHQRGAVLGGTARRRLRHRSPPRPAQSSTISRPSSEARWTASSSSCIESAVRKSGSISRPSYTARAKRRKSCAVL